MLLLIIVLFISAWNMGVFASVVITSGERGPYYLVTHKHTGSYEMIYQKIKQIQKYLDEKNINPLYPAVILAGNPFELSLSKLDARGGFIIKDSTGVDTPFVLQRITKRWVVTAAIKANPAIAPFKTYPALANFIRRDNIKQDSLKKIIELYHNNKSVEIELPIIKE
jgi:hypothetical protein